MEENNEFKPSEQLVEKKPKKIGIVIVILLVLIVLGLAGYVYYDRFYKKKEVKNNLSTKKADNEYYMIIRVSGNEGFIATEKIKVSKEEYEDYQTAALNLAHEKGYEFEGVYKCKTALCEIVEKVNDKIYKISDGDDTVYFNYSGEEVIDIENGCNPTITKTMQYKEFNDSYYKSNECTKYIISDLNIELIDTNIIEYDENEYIHNFILKINGKTKVDLISSGVGLSLGKFNDYLVARCDKGASDMMEMYIYDKNGDLAYYIPARDSNNCTILSVSSDGEVIVSQDYATVDDIMASNTCSIDKLSKDFKEYCPNDNYLQIFKKLEEVNGKLDLVEQNYKCETINID